MTERGPLNDLPYDEDWDDIATLHHIRGHLVMYDRTCGISRYAETGQPIPFNGGDEQPCLKCGLVAEPDGPDPCLGWLPGVKFACCGHGRGGAYITWENGTTARFDDGIEPLPEGVYPLIEALLDRIVDAEALLRRVADDDATLTDDVKAYFTEHHR